MNTESKSKPASRLWTLLVGMVLGAFITTAFSVSNSNRKFKHESELVVTNVTDGYLDVVVLRENEVEIRLHGRFIDETVPFLGPSQVDVTISPAITPQIRELARAILNVPGVVSTTFKPHNIEIVKADGFSWPDILDEITHGLKKLQPEKK